MNDLPPLPQKDHGNLDRVPIDLTPYWLDPTVEYPEPHFLLEYNGVGFSPLGGIQAISGQKKNGKTFFAAQLMAAILEPDSERVQAKLHGLTMPQSTRDYLGKKPTVLFIDTEMELLNTAKVFRRVAWLCGWNTTETNERFHVLALRTIADNPTRREMVLQAIEETHPTAVFIDGLRDLVNDINDSTESMGIINELMKVATVANCCIWSALHGNPKVRPEVEDNKMRGTLGTELGNKVTDTFVLIKKKDKATNEVTFTVSQQDARGKDVPDYVFEVTDDAGNLGIPRIIGAPPEPVKKPTEKLSQAEIDGVRDSIKPGTSHKWSKLRDEIMSRLGVTDKRAKKIIDIAKAEGYVTITDGLYTFIPKDNGQCPF